MVIVSPSVLAGFCQVFPAMFLFVVALFASVMHLSLGVGSGHALF